MVGHAVWKSGLGTLVILWIYALSSPTLPYRYKLTSKQVDRHVILLCTKAGIFLGSRTLGRTIDLQAFAALSPLLRLYWCHQRATGHTSAERVVHQARSPASDKP